MIETRLGNLGRPRQQIIRKRSRKRLACLVERHLLVERRADALRQPAKNLAVDDHRIDQHATVLDDYVIENLHVAEVGVDCDRHGMGRVAECAAVALWFVAAGRFEASGIDIAGQILRTAIPGVGDLGQANAAVRAAHAAVVQHDRSWIELKQLGTDPFCTFGELGAGGRDRPAGPHHRTRTPGAGRVGGQGGIAVHDANLRGVDAENFMGDLGQRRFKTLAVRMHADTEFEAAVRRHPRIGLFKSGHHRNAPAGINRGAMRRLLAIDRDAGADQPPIGLPASLPLPDGGNVDHRHRAPHRLRVITAVEMLVGDVVERHLAGIDQIAQSNFGGLEAGFGRYGVEHDLERKADAGARDAAIGQDWAFVRRRRKRPAAIGRHPVGTRQDARDLRRLEAGGKRVGGVGARIHRGLAVDAAQRTVAVGIDRDLVVMFAAIGAGRQMLAAILDPPHRVALAHCQPGEADLLGQQNALVAEAAADIGRHDPDPALLDVQTIREAVAHDVRHLRPGMQRELIEAVLEGCDDAASFERRHALPGGGYFPRDLDRRIQR